jgi:hypothetical protein
MSLMYDSVVDGVQIRRNNQGTQAGSSIPASLAPFFQEYHLDQLDLERSASTIIERVLQYGNRAEIRWLFGVYPPQQIAEWVRQWGNYALPEPHLTFWKFFLGLD